MRPFHALKINLKFRKDSNCVHKPLFASSSTKSGHTQHMNTSSWIPPMKDPICSYHDLIVARVMYLHLPISASCCCFMDFDANLVMCLHFPPLVAGWFWVLDLWLVLNLAISIESPQHLNKTSCKWHP